MANSVGYIFPAFGIRNRKKSDPATGYVCQRNGRKSFLQKKSLAFSAFRLFGLANFGSFGCNTTRDKRSCDEEFDASQENCIRRRSGNQELMRRRFLASQAIPRGAEAWMWPGFACTSGAASE